jgi:hypothetical protein
VIFFTLKGAVESEALLAFCSLETKVNLAIDFRFRRENSIQYFIESFARRLSMEKW